MTAAELLAECAEAGVSVSLSDTPGRLSIKWPSEEAARKFRPLLLDHRSELLKELTLASPPGQAGVKRLKAAFPAKRTHSTPLKSDGIETKYGGTTFRSRLEARWAHLLDELDLQWEYEPFDAKGYIPDFVIVGKRPLLLEVKPHANTTQMQQEVNRLNVALDGVWAGDVMIVGLTPFPSDTGDRDGWSTDAYPTAGLMGEHCPTWHGGDDWAEHCEAPFVWADAYWTMCDGCGRAGWSHSEMSFAVRPCGYYVGNANGAPVNRAQINQAFTRGRDLTRWRPDRR